VLKDSKIETNTYIKSSKKKFTDISMIDYKHIKLTIKFNTALVSKGWRLRPILFFNITATIGTISHNN